MLYQLLNLDTGTILSQRGKKTVTKNGCQGPEKGCTTQDTPNVRDMGHSFEYFCRLQSIWKTICGFRSLFKYCMLTRAQHQPLHIDFIYVTSISAYAKHAVGRRQLNYCERVVACCFNGKKLQVIDRENVQHTTDLHIIYSDFFFFFYNIYLYIHKRKYFQPVSTWDTSSKSDLTILLIWKKENK